MAILTFPSITPETYEFGIRYNTQVSTSPISGVTQTVEIPGARWFGRMSFRDMTPTESATLKAFLAQLRGSAGRFFTNDISHTSPFTPVTGTLTVGGSSTRRVVEVTVASGSFAPGDYIQIGDDDSRELKMIVAVSNISDDWTLTIEPTIRRTVYIGEAVEYTDPLGVFFLNASDQAKWNIRSKALLSDISIEFTEIFT